MIEIAEIFGEKDADKLQQITVAGIDIGSRAAKGVLISKGKLFYKIVPSGVSSIDTGKKLIRDLIKEAGIENKDINAIVGTGYGRVALDFNNVPYKSLTEISCHAKGAHYLNPKCKTIIDIGGQDSKAIKIDSYNGNVVEFIMNDKCAAGTGRFLEKVAQLLDLNLDELGEYAVRSEHPIEISSQCVVFAESEVVSLKATGNSKEDIAAGIHLATARRVHSLLRRTGFDLEVIFTGGVSHNRGMIKALEEVLGIKFGTTKIDATYAGALGAAIHAVEYAKELEYSFGGGL